MVTTMGSWRALLVASVVACSGCGSGDEEPCILLPAAYAKVTVTDAVTRARVCGADVSLSADGEGFVAEESTLSCGEYTVGSGKLDRDLQLLVEADGYRSYVTFVHVPTGRCGPETQSVDVALNPN